MPSLQMLQNSAVNIVVVEANQMNCQLIENAFRSRRRGVSVLASAVSSPEALHLLKERAPHVAVVSAQLRNGPLDGYRVVRDLRALQLKTRVVMLLESRERDLVIDAFRCGAHGVVFRDEPLETLGKCIHAVNRGQVWANSTTLGYLIESLSHAMPLRFQDSRGLKLLSKREVSVVRLVAEGMSNREVSKKLDLSEHTVRNYLFHIFDKLGVSTRVELVLYCLQERHGAPTNGPL